MDRCSELTFAVAVSLTRGGNDLNIDRMLYKNNQMRIFFYFVCACECMFINVYIHTYIYWNLYNTIYKHLTGQMSTRVWESMK